MTRPLRSSANLALPCLMPMNDVWSTPISNPVMLFIVRMAPLRPWISVSPELLKTLSRGEAEKTLFDPGKLGALTPAYASLEMLEGEEPDTRDDIYALGCVAYELLTGKHPFNKLPANSAKENGLVPAPVKGLKKKQNKALRKAVAFKREDRSQTVEGFIHDLEAKYVWYKSPLTIAAIITVAVGLGSIAPVINYLENQKVNTIITRH